MNQKSMSISLKDKSEFGRFFLFQFTKELIKHSGGVEVLELKEMLRDNEEKKAEKKWAEEFSKKLPKKPDIFEEFDEESSQEIDISKELKKPLPRVIPQQQMPIQPRKQIHTHLKTIDISKESREPLPRRIDIEEFKKPFSREMSPSFTGPLRVLRIPEPKLPPRLQYLRPRPTNIQLNLGILNPLVQDPTVDSIECYGSDKPIITRGRMGSKKTNIILDPLEIDTTIRRFSESAKIPIHEGVLKIARGRLILSAIVSTTIGSKFIIKKVKFNQLSMGLPQPGFQLTRQF